VLGSNRSGKTVCGVNEATSHSLGYRPWLPQDHPLRIVRLTNGQPIPVPNVGRIIAQNYEQAIRQTIMVKIDEWAPRQEIDHIEKNTRGIPVGIHWKNGSVMHLMSNDQDDMAFEGPSGHWAWFDEPPERNKYTGISRGLVDYEGHSWLTMTPLTQPWINDVLVSRSGDPDGDIQMFRFSIWDNCTDRGGYLTPEAIRAFLSDLDEREIEARLHGNFLHLAGLVYKEWKPRPPFWVPWQPIPSSWPRVCVVDPHPRKPIAVMWGACSPSNIWYFYRTLFDRSLVTVRDVADKIRHLEGWKNEQVPGPNADPVVLRIIDTSAESQERSSDTRGMNIRKKFAEISPFLAHTKAKKDNADFGYDAIHQALKMRYEWDTPGIVVMNTCPQIKQNFMNFCFDEWNTGRLQSKMGDKETYLKTHDDFIDGIRYIFQMGLTYQMLRSMMNQWARQWDSVDDFNFNPTGSLLMRTGTRTGYGT